MRFNGIIPLISILSFIFYNPNFTGTNSSARPSGVAVQVFGVTQYDLNNDHLPDLTIIDCSFATQHDRVLVYDQQGDMPEGSDWKKVTDFINDTWIFDAGSDGTAQLIVRFGKDGTRYTAEIYDDLNGDGQVSYRTNENQVIVEESEFWHVKVESSKNWVQQSELPNPKVSIFVDSYSGLIPGVNGVSGNDGEVDWIFEIGDQNGDGTNDYQLRRVVSPSLVGYYLPTLSKTAILVQATDRQPDPYLEPLFWPMLISKHNYEDYRYFDRTPAVAVDWQNGVVDRYGILGFPIEVGYHIYSRLPSEMNTLNPANFENPMAYYDMANDRDGWPELQVRFNVALPNDPFFPAYPYNGKIDTPNLEVDYSWDESNNNRWDYKLALGANYSIDEVVQFPGFSVKSVPYEQIIPWVFGKSWDVAILVFDSRPSPDSEGMYGKGWMVNRGYVNGKSVEPSGLNDRFLTGVTDIPPFEYYQEIQDFMRGEYSFQYFRTPKLYFSRFDHQLHLYGAQSGVWNLGEQKNIRYANLDGDAYLDQWQEQRDGILVQQVNYNRGYYVYSGNGQVEIKQTNSQQAMFETAPPGNYEEWQRLDGQLKTYQEDFSPDDFNGMLRHQAGPEMRLNKAAASDYRLTSNGFRFALNLQPGYIITGEDWLNLKDMDPGLYLVTYTMGSFEVLTMTPPKVGFAAPLEFSAGETLTAYSPNDVQVTLSNTGLQDAHSVELSFGAAQPGQKAEWLEPQVVPVLAGQETKVTFNWAPPGSGQWEISILARVLDEEGNEISSTAGKIQVQVMDAAQTNFQQEISAFGVVQPWQVAALAAAVLLAGGLTAWALFRAYNQDTP